MDNYFFNYMCLRNHVNIKKSVQDSIIVYYKGIEHINWIDVGKNRKVFNIEESIQLPFESRTCHFKACIQSDYEAMLKEKIEYITPKSIYFPNVLDHYKPVTEMLFIKGNKELMKTGKRAAIVGSRKPTAYGRKVAYDLSIFLASRGVQIISGMALGIDAVAHKGALDVKGKTIAVLASGVNSIYPLTNSKLYQEILQNQGAIISEYGLDEPPLKYQFPLRNRIISGLSDVVIIIEANEKSGSLITATHGLEQGKTVFALPGSIYSGNSKGTNKLIYDGAIPLIDFNDVLSSIGIDHKTASKTVVLPDHLSEKARIIYHEIVKKGKIEIEEIALKLNFEYSEINSALSELILDDLCQFESITEIGIK